MELSTPQPVAGSKDDEEFGEDEIFNTLNSHDSDERVTSETESEEHDVEVEVELEDRGEAMRYEHLHKRHVDLQTTDSGDPSNARPIHVPTHPTRLPTNSPNAPSSIRRRRLDKLASSMPHFGTSLPRPIEQGIRGHRKGNSPTDSGHDHFDAAGLGLGGVSAAIKNVPASMPTHEPGFMPPHIYASTYSHHSGGGLMDAYAHEGRGAAGIGVGMSVGGVVGGLLSATAPTRKLLERVLPDPGTGPSPAAQEKGFFDVRFVAEGPAGTDRTLRTRVLGDRDPGYGATSRMLGETALALAAGEATLGGGHWTPGAALGDSLLRRLPANAGVTFSVLD